MRLKNTNNSRAIEYSAAPDSLTEYTKKIWHFKHLIYTFTYQEIKTQYTQTYFNWLWLVIKPLMVLSLFAFIFNYVFHIPSLTIPYPLFAFTGLVIWNNFSYMVANGGGVINANQGLARKMYFPRIILILSKSLSGLVELTISLLLVFVLALIYHYPLTLQVLALPLLVLLNTLIGTGVAIWLNAFSIKRRDINHLAQQLIGFLIWLTPVFYPANLIPEKISFLVYLNPIAGIIQGCRWAILGDSFPSLYFLPGITICIGLTAAGFVYFAKQEDIIADNA